MLTEPAAAASLHHPRFFADDLRSFGDHPAAVTADGRRISYRELAERVDALRTELGTTRRLILVAGTNTIEMLTAYLAALAGRHPVILTGSEAGLGGLVNSYDPDVVLSGAGVEWQVVERRSGTTHELHPDLALLLSTSGSTGSPKLVRLSYENLRSNADAIAQFLEIGHEDRAALTLPMHYCYGLSVVNSHLTRGATIILADDSVVDPCFWRRFRASEATNIAGVPYTFDLLDRVGFASMDLPSLRFVTQAGGRLRPEAVLRYARLGRQRGWHFYVMYGQTEATARMAYLPPESALDHPNAIGVAIPGGSLEIDATDGCEEGELLYRGPNVMLGYAHGPDDLAVGRTVDVLRTGDLARQTSDGLFEIVGRKSRFAKIFGLRIDLDRVEGFLDDHDCSAICAADDERLHVAVRPDQDRSAVAHLLQDHLALPRRCIRVFLCDDIPRLASGKPDHRGIVALGQAAPNDRETAVTDREHDGPETLRDLFASVLDIEVPDDGATFVSLGGDSLSYVELSIAMEEEFGELPPGWHLLPIREIERRAPRLPTRSSLSMDIILRAVATVLIVGSHVKLFNLRGGAHLLLAVSGYNFARFFLRAGGAAATLHRTVTIILRIALPTLVGVAVFFAVSKSFLLSRALLFYNYENGGLWRYWYIEVLIQTLVVLAFVVSNRRFRGIERARPFETAVGIVAVGLLLRGAAEFDLLLDNVRQTHNVFWLFALGWATERCATPRQRALVSAGLLVGLPGFFDDLSRGLVVLVGVGLLIWVPRMPIPSPLHAVVGMIASSSLYIYLSQFEVYRLLLVVLPPVAVVPATIGIGIGIAVGIDAGLRRARSAARSRRRSPTPASRPRHVNTA